MCVLSELELKDKGGHASNHHTSFIMLHFEFLLSVDKFS
ncbi:hypothetical protein BTN50_0142 [Candidatus Enterovibrio altilux]|uniref:Uncharacterized protein n=1 Tax=Candidatus Enterovibrio altilux TaxID=1927128 RepID=A0A291B6R5_9GAMM|nr:hypothetical protein BTN50_0142 [Candidatus Enterovibrio luxaltus]